ncbi:nucleobase:cation symporter-1, NCS1 family [Metschnikowia aff. pulcherrima]|uniref:Nucleobase:cation symporter-1, NCS1 family n=1 Tax=Metschnikowia aff. pulcherrima TaxID=2163413 RepID=A0A4P6XDR0_9ASCO|nr:nucleobase:cation symporter-1, NCS1 family [Metschnikowia aff. pulcherrima]
MSDSLKHVTSVGEQEVSSSTDDKSTWQKILSILRVEDNSDLTTTQKYLYNFDLRPVEAARRQWSWYNFVFFWVADSFNINTWMIAATGVEAGMTWWQTWLSVWVGYLLAGIFVSLSARVGVVNHISFPIGSRASFGIFFAIWPVINRVVMSCVWYSVQAMVAGPCIGLMLRSIFGQNLQETMPNGILNKNVTTFEFLSFFLFWLFSLPFLWFPPHKIRHLFTVKAYISPVAGVAFLIWTLVKSHGAGPVIHAPSALQGLALAWAFVESTMNSLANFATLITNAPDFSRFADKPSFAIKYVVQTVSIPLCFSITSLIGILVSSASTELYGTTYWSPLDVLGRFLDNYSSGNRAGVFFISFAFAIAQLGTNISANSLSFGTDVTALLPQYMNIRRGSYLCALLALVVQPWNLLLSSSKFTTYLSAYSVFLSSIIGVICSDYYVVRRGHLKLTHMYSTHAPSDKTQRSDYMYNRFGTNWRALIAYLCGILPNIVGFVGATSGTDKVPMGANEVYRLNFFMGFFSSGIVYVALTYFFPVAGTPDVKLLQKGWFEENQDVEDFEQELLGHVHEGFEAPVSVASSSYQRKASQFD